MERQIETEQVVEETKRVKKIEMDRKVRTNMLKRQLKMDKVDRSKRAVEYKREIALQKIEEDAKRQRQIKAFKEAVADERKEMQRQALLASVEMERQVEAVKKKMAKESAKAAENVIEAAKQDIAAGETGEAPRSAPSSPNKQTREHRNRTKESGHLDPISPGSDGLAETHPRSSSAQGGSKSRSGSKSGKRTAAMGKEHKALMAEDQVQAMWRGQNERLLRLLEEEEVREAEREQSIKAVQYEMMERQRLEREFDKERQAARERIVRMTQEHEKQLLMRMNDLGLIGGNQAAGQHMVFA